MTGKISKNQKKTPASSAKLIGEFSRSVDNDVFRLILVLFIFVNYIDATALLGNYICVV